MFSALFRMLTGKTADNRSLYEKLGGEAAIDAAVDIFYRKVLADDRVNQFFEGVDMEKQAAKQKAFLTMAFGGPNNYTGRDMRLAHAHLVEQGLNDTHVDVIIELLGETLKELNVPDELIQEVARIADSVRADVLAGYTEEEKKAMGKDKSLYEQLGGEAAVDAAVDIFYRKVLADPRVNQFFEGVDMEKQAAKQKAFLTMAFGGPNNYTGRDMRLAHAYLVEQGLNDTHVDVIIELLGETLKELNVPDDLIAQVADIANSVRADVLAGYTQEEKQAMNDSQSLYERLGGEAAVNAAVDIFYRKVLADPRVNQFFEGVDMEKQAAKQKAFLTMAFGGPNNYTGKDMCEAHRHLLDKGLNDTHVDVIIELLGETLKELGVADDLIQEVAAIAESVRDDVLCRRQAS